MNIAIDGYEANVPNRVGIGQFAFEIIHRLHKKTAQHSFHIYVPSAPLPHMPPETHHWTYHRVRPQKLWTMIGLPLALWRDKPDVVFSPTHYVPRWVGIPKIMAIMDVSYLHYPELFRPQDLHKLVNWTAYSVSKAVRIITISEFSKNAIIDAYHIEPERIVVAYPGLRMESNTTRKKSPGAKPYILSVGTLQPRKNFVRLIEAFSMLKDTEIELVLVGKRGWLYNEIIEAPEKFGVAGRVRFLDFVPEKQLPDLYKNATCFALPSLYEGFGLPVLEAMSYGIPVVVSNTSSLPEIAGDAGIYVDPHDTNDIKKGLTVALTDNNTKRIALGKKRVSLFTWDNAADKVMKVLEDAGAKTYAGTH